jgi:thiamine transport system ATP-binding protein
MVDLHLDGLRKEYGPTTALADVDLSVADGEFFTLVGPSGCGKTTTLRLVAGFESPTGGRVRFGDRDVAGVPPEDRGVGVVFQNYALFGHMSVAENVGYGLRFADPPGGASPADRVAALLEMVDLPGMGDRSPDELSGGQQQRVALARALAPGPQLLLLDEPMSALDARLRERLRVQVRELQRELGVTTLYVTHDQAEALAVSDRVAVMRDGRVEQVGTPREVYHRPATRFVAEFVGDNNVLDGDVSEPPAETEGGSAGRASGTGGRDREGGDGVASLDVDGTTFRVAVDGLDGPVRRGDRLTVCVRPEDLRVGAGANRLRATVTSTEFLGESTRVHLDWGGRELLLRAEDPPEGTVEVGFDPGDVHVVSRAADDWSGSAPR